MTRRGFITQLTAGIALARAALAQDSRPADGATPQPAASQPGFRKPRQADELAPLLRQQEARPINPVVVGRGERVNLERDRQRGLLADGVTVPDRAGRLLHEADRPMFEFATEDGSRHRMELLRNSLLEAMEQELATGADEFIVSAEVTRYRGANYMLLRKVLRRVTNGNLSP
jgi:hypothetical protein